MPRALTQVPQLPRELIAKIFREVWRARDAAVRIQKHVRGSIARADGAPWDMPALVEPEFTLTDMQAWELQHMMLHMSMHAWDNVYDMEEVD